MSQICRDELLALSAGITFGRCLTAARIDGRLMISASGVSPKYLISEET